MSNETELLKIQHELIKMRGELIGLRELYIEKEPTLREKYTMVSLPIAAMQLGVQRKDSHSQPSDADIVKRARAIADEAMRERVYGDDGAEKDTQGNGAD